MRLAALTLALAVVSVTACSENPDAVRADYCAAVKEQRDELTRIAAEGSLFDTLDIYRDLQGRAPSDIADEWQHVVTRIEALEELLRELGVDPATYDRENPPEGLSRGERKRIEAAAGELLTGETRRSMNDIQQQALDVCKTPLTL